MEPKVEQDDNNEEQSFSKPSHHKNRRIRKSPKPLKNSSEQEPPAKKDTIFSSLRVIPQFGVFESEMQKQSRLEKFWLVEIDNFYKTEVSPSEKEMLSSILQEEVPSLREVLAQYNQILPSQRVPFEELFRYIELVQQCKLGSQLMLLENYDKRFLAIFDRGGELDRMAEITQEEAFLISQRHKFMEQLRQRQQKYNELNNQNQHLSDISAEVAFLLYLMRQNKARINNTLIRIQERIHQQPRIDLNSSQNIKDNYVSCLIRKNIRLALQNKPIDFLNYYSNLDALEQYGSIDQDQKLITDKKEFEEYMKKKKGKKSRKNPKGVLKTGCGGCLSSHYEQYNPFSYCPDCHVRFHKYCYTPYKDSLCESCFHKKEPVFKGRVVECQFCSNRGLLSVPLKSVKEGVSIHVFCMLINGLWKFQNGELEFRSNSFVNSNMYQQVCSICNSSVYTYPCCRCGNKAHPLCAYLHGWDMEVSEEGNLTLQCCQGVELDKNSYRRKFMLNYKKLLYKEHKQR